MKKTHKWMLALALWSTPALTTAANAQTDWQNQIGESAEQARAQWQKLTQGEELARGKKVLFSPPPNYHLTTDENDPYDLTDGTLSSRTDDRVWFNTDAVGWYQIAAAGVQMVIDLGSPQPIGQIAIRVLGGHEQKTLDLPAAIRIFSQ